MTEKDHVWISKIYDILSMDKYILDEIMRQNLAECGITSEDLSRMENENLIRIKNNALTLKPGIYEYVKPDILRSNWIYLEPMTRRRFLGNSAIPTILDIIKESKGIHINHNTPMEKIANDDEIKLYIKYYNDPGNAKILMADIYNYNKKHGRSINFISSIHLDESTVNRIKRTVHIIDTNESCPIGLNKEECEAVWKKDNGIDTYAYKDFIIDGVKLRIHLSAAYKGIYYNIDPHLSCNNSIEGRNLYKTLDKEGILDRKWTQPIPRPKNTNR
jgi:hypothetical protein